CTRHSRPLPSCPTRRSSDLTLTGATAGSATVNLGTQNNVIGTVSSTNTLDTVSIRDDAGFTVGTLTTDTAVTLSSNGTVDQSGRPEEHTSELQSRTDLVCRL